ncbi:putative quinol monooxygenase [Nesterenkonia aerolata]|uniref:Quinol monooxygenase n=1 Tax=Nesterenkonia aerolata TaxID=3074079 RepID=A0ABU2DST3_9MICC|nr:putative quinol monooxygenase [Nesterenkonia sp. LY-0111]MDR8019562.1 putative quinol monooxygenase [Nesterenkonia sp. LY-0111]
MIFIVVKFPVKPEAAEEFPEHVAEFTAATRAEPGNKWFEWSRNIEDPHEYVLVEAFDDDAAEAHVNSEHFQRFVNGPISEVLTATPKIISRQIDGDDWDEMGEISVS